MTIVPKSQIDAENAVRAAYSNAVAAVIAKVVEIRKSDSDFLPTKENINGNAELGELVGKAEAAGTAAGASFDPEKEFQRYLRHEAIKNQ